jgi:hypothetical protein
MAFGEAELKSQGALEASRDPNSSVTAQEAENIAVEEAKKSGSAAIQFDPDATPEQKAAQARSVRSSCICYNPCTDTLYSTYRQASTTNGTRTRLP